MEQRIGRRDILRIAGGCCLAAGAGYAAAIEPKWLEMTEHLIAVPDLPVALRGYRIAQLSDLHLSELGSLHDHLLDLVRAHDPQLIALTGDVLEETHRLAVVGELCRALSKPGRHVVATLGNWEHWGNVPRAELEATYLRSGARLLGNESVRLDSGMSLVSIDDACSGHADPRRALASVPAAPVRLLLTHAPAVFDDLPTDGPQFDLGLAGHTHGGQVRAVGAAVWTPPGSGRFRSGMYDTPLGRAYVSRGIGTSVLAVRFACRPEMPIFRLETA